MENNNKIVPPHLNAEVYRNAKTGTSTLHYLDYIHLHTDGTILIGSSELTGRYWNGGVNVLKDVNEENNYRLEKDIQLTSGTADGCFIQNSRVLLCEDSGAVSIWSVLGDEVSKNWTEELSVAEHDDAVLAVGCLEPRRQYVTAGADGNVKVWDISDLICLRNYSRAHTMAVSALSVRTNSQTCFATGSLDQYISLWDENTTRPVCDVFRNNCGIRCLRWLNENNLIFGDEAGVLSVLDVRMPEIATKITEFPAAVHRIAVQPGMKKLAVSCDNKILTVCEITDDMNIKILSKEKNKHDDFIRGLAWDISDTNLLYSVGWDGQLIKSRVD